MGMLLSRLSMKRDRDIETSGRQRVTKADRGHKALLFKKVPEILGEIHTLWTLSQTSLGFCEKCEHIPLTGWKTLSGAIAVFPAAVPVWFH